MRIQIPVVTTLVVFLLSPCVLGADEPMMLKGRVINQENQPVAGAKIVIHDEENGGEIKGEADGKGKFAIKHDECSYFSFDVIPPGNSSLSRAHFQHVSGESGKHFIVQLHKGFAIKGRVIAGGVGIKGLVVKVSPNDTSMTNVEVVHGGGTTLTGRNGEYQLTLTPGQKLIEIRNDRYSDLSTSTQQQVAVSGDTRIPDIVLPVAR